MSMSSFVVVRVTFYNVAYKGPGDDTLRKPLMEHVVAESAFMFEVCFPPTYRFGLV